MKAWESGIIPAFLSAGITAALRYAHPQDVQSLEVAGEVQMRGVSSAFTHITGISTNHELTRMVSANYHFHDLHA